MILTKTTVGLGVLAIPGAFKNLGLLLGIVCLLIVGGIVLSARRQ